MQATLILKVIKTLYPLFRPILVQAIDDPSKQWDDVFMQVLDKMLFYKKEDSS
jgi:hypothetical protein